MADEPADPKADAGGETPDGAAVFPLIPAELGVHPATLAALHAYVFLEGSEANVVNPTAAEEAMHYVVTYLQRLTGADLKRVKEDFRALADFARGDGWPKQQVRFLQDFLKENAIGGG